VGGLGGIGLELAQWLVERGARYLVLTSRVGVRTGYQDRRIREWRQAGVTVSVSRADVCDADQTRALIRDAVSMCPGGFGSVFNLAAVLHDGLTVNQTAADWARVTKPKVRCSLELTYGKVDLHVGLLKIDLNCAQWRHYGHLSVGVWTAQGNTIQGVTS